MPRMSKNEIVDIYLGLLDRAFDKKGWHGPTLRGALRGVTFKEALWRPTPKHHNIWELTLHAAYWKYVVRRRLTGEDKNSFSREGSNWFKLLSKPTQAAWKKDVDLLNKENAKLKAVIDGLSPFELRRIEKKDGMISGIAAHDLYHAGQIQLLKRLIRGGVAKPAVK
jgi:hypothetical protein